MKALRVVIKNDRSRWFERVECKDDADLVKNCTVIEVAGDI